MARVMRVVTSKISTKTTAALRNKSINAMSGEVVLRLARRVKLPDGLTFFFLLRV